MLKGWYSRGVHASWLFVHYLTANKKTPKKGFLALMWHTIDENDFL